jgi:hypothetical protein
LALAGAGLALCLSAEPVRSRQAAQDQRDCEDQLHEYAFGTLTVIVRSQLLDETRMLLKKESHICVAKSSSRNQRCAANGAFSFDSTIAG